METIEAILFGVAALAACVSAVMLLRQKKRLLCSLVGVCEILLTVLSAYNWRQMLIHSGKDAAWFGAKSYPVATVVLALLLLAGIAFTALGIVLFVRRRRAVKSGAAADVSAKNGDSKKS